MSFFAFRKRVSAPNIAMTNPNSAVQPDESVLHRRDAHPVRTSGPGLYRYTHPVRTAYLLVMCFTPVHASAPVSPPPKVTVLPQVLTEPAHSAEAAVPWLCHA